LTVRGTRAIHVIAVTTAKGKDMITANAEVTQDSQATAEQPKATKKARVGAQSAHVAPAKKKAVKKAAPAKKAPKSANNPQSPVRRVKRKSPPPGRAARPPRSWSC
jgi:hypothetical protein